MDYTDNELKDLKETLKNHNLLYCKCGREIDMGDFAWNNAETKSGTPHSAIEIICQKCNTEIIYLESWYPEICNIKDLIAIINNEVKK